MSTNITNYLSIPAYLNLSDDERYEEVRRATIAATGPDYFAKYYKTTKNRWLDLARVWDKVYTCQKNLVLTSVVHKVYWGVTPYESSDPDFTYLLSLVEAELLDDREGFQMFKKWIVFKRVVGMTLDSTESFGTSCINTCFVEHHHYLQSRALCKLIYDKDPPCNYNSYVQEYQGYERIVNFLIPDSVNWSRAQWGDDLWVADALEQLYCVDYAESDRMQRNYERIVLMLRTKDVLGVDSADFLWYASNISELPLSLAQKIWPANLEHTVANILWKTHVLTVDYENCGQPFRGRANDFHPHGHFVRGELKQSWVFKLARKWYYEGKYSGVLREQMKAVIFDLEMTV